VNSPFKDIKHVAARAQMRAAEELVKPGANRVTAMHRANKIRSDALLEVIKLINEESKEKAR
jgi:hypothetical protein